MLSLLRPFARPRRTPPSLVSAGDYSLGRRWASKRPPKGQRRGRGKKGGPSSPGKKNAKAKPALPKSTAGEGPGAANNVGSMAPPPSVRKDLPKAPHMHMRPSPTSGKLGGIPYRLSSSDKGGAMEWLVANPVLFFGIILPTVGMGLAIYVRPDLRARVFGAAEEGRGGIRIGANAEEVPEPVYEQGGTPGDAEAVAAMEEFSREDESIVTFSSEDGNEKKEGRAWWTGLRPHPS
ncbi:hypothetical protein ACHAXT_004208 [Thalassiosira profunda]